MYTLPWNWQFVGVSKLLSVYIFILVSKITAFIKPSFKLLYFKPIVSIASSISWR
jgi:hypothetical protein